MPTYQYRCRSCGHELEAVQKFTDPSLTECPECSGVLKKVFNAVGVVFKGSGFYRTDSRNDSTSRTTADSKSGDSGSKDSGGSGSKDSGGSGSKDSGGSGSKDTGGSGSKDTGGSGSKDSGGSGDKGSGGEKVSAGTSGSSGSKPKAAATAG